MVQFVAGVDTHKDSHTIVFIDAVGEPVANLVISNDCGFPEGDKGRQKARRRRLGR